MRRASLAAGFLALLLTLSACGDDDGGASFSPSLKVMSFNVLCSICNPREYDPWAERLDYFEDIFARYDPDLIGVQELTPLGNEIGQLLAQAPGRTALYYRPPGDYSYPDAAIFYRTERFELVEEGSYWLSPTPDEPLSTGFVEFQLPRLVYWARLRDLAAGGQEIFFATTHFDNNSPSQQLSAPLLQERTAPYVAEQPVIVIGDFNSRPNSTAYRLLTEDATHGFVFQNSFDLAPTRIVTNQVPAPEFDVADRIDHIFLAGADLDWVVDDWAVDMTVYGARDRYPSDHFAIYSEVRYREQ